MMTNEHVGNLLRRLKKQTELFIQALLLENQVRIRELVETSLRRREETLLKLNPLAYRFYEQLQMDEKMQPVLIEEEEYLVREHGGIICKVCGWKSRRRKNMNIKLVYALHRRGKQHLSALGESQDEESTDSGWQQSGLPMQARVRADEWD